MLEITNLITKVNVDVATEAEGLDKAEIGEEAYLMLGDYHDENPDLLFCDACGEGNITEIKRLFKMHGEVNIADYDGRTPIHIAASKNHI